MSGHVDKWELQLISTIVLLGPAGEGQGGVCLGAGACLIGSVFKSGPYTLLRTCLGKKPVSQKYSTVHSGDI